MSALLKSILMTVCYFVFQIANAQIKLPFGNTLDLNSSNDILYLETRILFNTGQYKSEDYCWNKISDSLDKRWLVTSCFNGDCKNDLLQSGCFIKDYGLNDTTCFIAFHVESHGFEGISVVKYNVTNKKNNADKADLIFNIRYTNPAAIKTEELSPLLFFPNPVSSEINVQSPIEMNNVSLCLINISGQLLLSRNYPKFNAEVLDLSDLEKGLYFLEIKVDEKIIRKKIIRE